MQKAASHLPRALHLHSHLAQAWISEASSRLLPSRHAATIALVPGTIPEVPRETGKPLDYRPEGFTSLGQLIRVSNPGTSRPNTEKRDAALYPRATSLAGQPYALPKHLNASLPQSATCLATSLRASARTSTRQRDSPHVAPTFNPQANPFFPQRTQQPNQHVLPPVLVRFLSAAAETTEGGPVSSPLLSSLAKIAKADKEAPGRTVQAKLAGLKEGVRKLNLVATLVRGMTVEDALNQMAVSTKRAAKTVAKVVHAAKSNAVQNHGLDGSKLIVAEAFVGKGLFIKRMNPHAKGRSGIKVRQRSQLTVVVREEAAAESQQRQAARPGLSVWRVKLRRLQRQRLAPHRLVEVGPTRPGAGAGAAEAQAQAPLA